MNNNEDNKPPTWRPKYPLGSWEYFTKPANVSTTELLQGLEFTLFARPPMCSLWADYQRLLELDFSEDDGVIEEAKDEDDE